jgi:hypothetical protein
MSAPRVTNKMMTRGADVAFDESIKNFNRI